MNRWQEYFNTQIKNPWDQLIKEINDLSSEDIIDSSILHEILRLKKMAVYLDEIISSIDTDFLILHEVDEICNHINNCKGFLQNFNQNKDKTYIEQSNLYLDYIYKFLNKNMPFFKGNKKIIGAEVD